MSLPAVRGEAAIRQRLRQAVQAVISAAKSSTFKKALRELNFVTDFHNSPDIPKLNHLSIRFNISKILWTHLRKYCVLSEVSCSDLSFGSTSVRHWLFPSAGPHPIGAKRMRSSIMNIGDENVHERRRVWLAILTNFLIQLSFNLAMRNVSSRSRKCYNIYRHLSYCEADFTPKLFGESVHYH